MRFIRSPQERKRLEPARVSDAFRAKIIEISAGKARIHFYEAGGYNSQKWYRINPGAMGNISVNDEVFVSKKSGTYIIEYKL